LYQLGPAGVEQGVLQKERYIVHAECAEINLTILLLMPTEKSFCQANNRLMI